MLCFFSASNVSKSAWRRWWEQIVWTNFFKPRPGWEGFFSGIFNCYLKGFREIPEQFPLRLYITFQEFGNWTSKLRSSANVEFWIFVPGIFFQRWQIDRRLCSEKMFRTCTSSRPVSLLVHNIQPCWSHSKSVWSFPLGTLATSWQFFVFLPLCPAMETFRRIRYWLRSFGCYQKMRRQEKVGSFPPPSCHLQDCLFFPCLWWNVRYTVS